MTFNQWRAMQDLTAREAMAAETIWNALVDRGLSVADTERMLNDLVGEMQARHHEVERKWKKGW